MNGYKKNAAFDVLIAVTECGLDYIETYSDHELEAWLYELGYEWRDDRGAFGAWLPIPDPIVFASVPVHVECSDFGPLFAGTDGWYDPTGARFNS